MASTDLLPTPAISPELATKLELERARLTGERLAPDVLASRLNEYRLRIEAEHAATLQAARINLTDAPDRFDCCGLTADVIAALGASLAARPDDDLAAAKQFARAQLEDLHELRIGVFIRMSANPGDAGWTLEVDIAHYVGGG